MVCRGAGIDFPHLIDSAIASLSIQFVFVTVAPTARLALLQVRDVVVTVIDVGACGNGVIKLAVVDEAQRGTETAAFRGQSGQRHPQRQLPLVVLIVSMSEIA